ncbi:hypothetical protein, partial [Tychonema bourrellyi]|uniref:hypothetical protein n=1 Tax=Tychonema bourrellyi TaxID=54313 RepID=UPI001C5572CF
LDIVDFTRSPKRSQMGSIDEVKMQNHNQNEIAHFTLPKVGEHENDIQDAFYYSSDRSIVAIADGASTSLWPREWANLLVEHFCDHNQDSIAKISEGWEEWLRPLQEEWRQHSLKIKKDSTIPWYAQGSREKDHGSATFVGLKFRPPNQAGERIWEALAVGDSCLFQIKANSNELVTFPLKKSEQFTTVTNCFHSLPEYKSYPPVFTDGLYEEGDIFFLATDALAEWIIKDCEDRIYRWKNLLSVATQEEFSNFINQLRDDKLIKNDDTTLLRLKVVIPGGEKTKPLEPNQPKPNTHNCQPIVQKKYGHLSNKIFKKRVRLLIFSALVIIAGIAISNIYKNQYFNANLGQNSPENKVLPSQSSTATNSKIPDPKNVPIYSADNNNDRPIGYLFDIDQISSTPKLLYLWVLVEFSYLDTTQNIIIIPHKARSPLFPDKEIKKLTPKDFLGVLLPGTYSFTEPKNSATEPKNSATEPKKSATFNDQGRWVKIQVRLTK